MDMDNRQMLQIPEPREYLASGTITLIGVQFVIIASSQEEAEAKAERGEWHDYDIAGASSSDSNICASTIKENV